VEEADGGAMVPVQQQQEEAMAGRYDRNPFDEDDVNPFAVSNRCTLL